MLLFNFKLFFKIAVAILSGTSVVNTDSTSADSIIKSETAKPRTETVRLTGDQENAFKFNNLKEVSVDSAGLFLDTPKTIKEFKSVMVGK